MYFSVYDLHREDVAVTGNVCARVLDDLDLRLVHRDAEGLPHPGAPVLHHDHLLQRPALTLHNLRDVGLELRLTRGQGHGAILDNGPASRPPQRVQMLGNGLTLPPVFVHNLNVHLGLDVTVEMVNSLELYPAQFALVGSLASVDTHVILQIVARTELLVAHFTVVLLSLVFLLDMTSEVGG